VSSSLLRTAYGVIQLSIARILVQRDGYEAARAWVERALPSYREAVTKPEPCLQIQVPPLFEQASGELEEWSAR
jgi:hypothetical protein